MLCFMRWRKSAPIVPRLPRDSRPRHDLGHIAANVIAVRSLAQLHFWEAACTLIQLCWARFQRLWVRL
jgi:hypothetical protein